MNFLFPFREGGGKTMGASDRGIAERERICQNGG